MTAAYKRKAERPSRRVLRAGRRVAQAFAPVVVPAPRKPI